MSNGQLLLGIAVLAGTFLLALGLALFARRRSQSAWMGLVPLVIGWQVGFVSTQLLVLASLPLEQVRTAAYLINGGTQLVVAAVVARSFGERPAGAPADLLPQIRLVLKKELLTEWRDKSRVSGVFFFALAILIMVAFSTPQSSTLPKIAGGALWLGLMLSSTRSMDQSYAVEHEHGAMDGLLLWPVEPVAIYYGKAIANTLILIAVAVVMMPLLLAMYEVEIKGDPVLLMGVIVAGCAALAAPGTLYGLITSQARGSSVLLPLLLFPLVVPAIMAASNATSKIMAGDPMGQAPAWFGVLVAFDVVHWSIMSLIYGRILED